MAEPAAGRNQRAGQQLASEATGSAARSQLAEHRAVSTMAATAATAQLPTEVLAGLLPRLTGRLLSRELRAYVDASVTSARLRAGAPLVIVRKLVLETWGATLERLSLRAIHCVDDALLAEMLDSLPRLRCVDVSECTSLRPTSLHRLRGSKCLESWTAEGCWRMLRPCPELSPETVLRVQYTALQQNGNIAEQGEGVAVCFQFAAPSNRAQTGPLKRFARMIETGYPVMLDESAAVSVERLPPAALHPQLGRDGESHMAVFLVEYRGQQEPSRSSCNMPQYFAWAMALQTAESAGVVFAGCWMTVGVMPVLEHSVQAMRRQLVAEHTANR
jgi:hypothetical protein